MMILIVFLVCFLASVVGAVCGIGGGVIIKPTLDALGILDVSTISFLSGCTVLSMTSYSVLSSRKSSASSFDPHIGLPLSIGAAAGGIIGKQLFEIVKSLSNDPNRVGAVQAAFLLIVTLGTLLYTIFKDKIPTHQVRNRMFCLIIGLGLGIMSAFLGIGGGPINLVLLFWFFSMDTKCAAENSLYMIFFSQAASLVVSILSGTVPQFPLSMLLLMVCGGIFGGICGRNLNKKLNNQTVDKLFIALMILMIFINLYNIFLLI